MGNHDQFGLNDELLPGAIERVRQDAAKKKESWRIVPDNLREREPVRRGRAPKNKLSRALLNGSTIFVAGQNKTFGSLYTLARNHNKVCKTQRTEINGEYGTLVWFDLKHGSYGNEGYCYCGTFVGHNGDWSEHMGDE